MNQVNWKQKLTSRKLWAAVVGVVVGLAAAFGISENEYAQVAGVVGSVVSVVSYIFGEASVDAAKKGDGGKLPASEDAGKTAENAGETGMDAVELAYEQGYRHFLCGMAQGCDLYFCETVLRLR